MVEKNMEAAGRRCEPDRSVGLEQSADRGEGFVTFEEADELLPRWDAPIGARVPRVALRRRAEIAGC